MLVPSIFGENIVDNFFNDVDRDWFTAPAFGNQVQGIMKTDVRENENSYELDVELPGYDKSDLNLELNDGYLTISAKKDNTKEEKDNSGKVIRRERYQGAAQRSFFVGDDITEEDVKAKFNNGVLMLTIPKKDKEQEVPEKKTIAIE